MTTGQRIAEKRKELGLSQEALGQELGVSRQSVYKWESDAALPEIDKLVALSRRFGVPVGWLLGVEDPSPEQQASLDPEQLQQEQEKLAQRIAEKYLEARPGISPRRRMLMKVCVGAAAVCLAFGLWRMSERLEQMESRYDSLMHSVINLNSSVSSQISGITRRVEQAVKGQNEIAADYSADVRAVDIPGNTVTFSAMALPKEEPEDLAVLFAADFGGEEPVTVAGVRQGDGTWRADLTCPLTDGIQLSVIFETGGTRKNQRLEYFSGLYGDTFPALDLQAHSMFIFKDLGGEDLDVLTYTEEYAFIRRGNTAPTVNPVAGIREIRVGFFKNRQLVCWLEPIEGTPPNWHGFDEKHQYYKLSKLQLKLTPEDVVGLAAVVTDEYGRERVYPDMYYRMDAIDDRGRELTYADHTYVDRISSVWQY